MYSCRSRQLHGYLTAGLATLLVTSTYPATTQGEGRLRIPSMTEGVNLLRAQKWGEAAKVYREILKLQPKNGFAWFQLGYVLHADRKLEEAIKIHIEAAKFGNVRSTALYNLACAYSLTGRDSQALAALKKSYLAGFDNGQLAQTDPDLDNLRNKMDIPLPTGRVLEEMDLSDGELLDYHLALPPDFDEDRTYPVLLAFPSGNQKRAASETAMATFWGQHAAQRGWIVLSLIKPTGGWESDKGVAYMRELMVELDGRFNVQGGKYYIAGRRRGGASAFHIAMALAPRIHALLGISAHPASDDESGLGRLRTVPVRMFCGAEDDDLLGSMKRGQRGLQAAGVDAELTVYPGQQRVMQTLRGGGFAIILENLRRSINGSTQAG